MKFIRWKSCQEWLKQPINSESWTTESDPKLSTYVNALAKAGFAIEEMIEESDEEIIQAQGENEFSKKAKMLPVTFVIKARRL
ncbi:hypothetical protein J41TS12_03780 [Paenibacillus antibioticophila]|uniref:SAM-dependent methyltransferase n=1 Tax=Paenibacillus antibioticophila TaxID=1274374 RepID=A0A920CGB4_9BACL|nr:hypothetical protein J41TS12_03780 [Paenibacillus antibioticophila]